MVKDKVIPGGLFECPHCQQEILEKHTFSANGRTYHSDCRGAIKLPPPTADQMLWLDRLTRGAPVPESDQENLPAARYIFS